MRQCRVLKESAIVAEKVNIADTYFLRLKGLLSKKSIGEREALLICPCKQIHTFGMKFSIDAVFLSAKNEVLNIVHSMPPNKVSPYVRDAHMVLELHQGALSRRGVKKHDVLTIDRLVEPAISK